MKYPPEPQSMSFSGLMNDIERGLIKIPQFQREFVWSKDKSAKLLDSIVKSYPIGTFILWKTKEPLRTVRNIGGASLPATPAGDFVHYVLDGQQRLASLYAAYRGLKVEREERSDDFREMYVDLHASNDDEIILTSHDGREDNSLIRIVDLLNANLTFLTSYPKELHAKLDEYKKKLESYRFSVIMVTDASIDVATEIFTRINVTGRPLAVFEIMVAKTFDAGRDFDLAERFDRLSDRLRSVDYDTIPASTVLQAVSMVLTGECSKKQILKLEKSAFIDVWPGAQDAIERAVEYFRNVYRIPVSRLLPYAALLVPYTYFFFHHPDRPTSQARNFLQEFFWRCSLGGRYSYALETKLAQDIRRIDAVLRGQAPEYDYPVEISAEFVEKNGWFNPSRSYTKAILCLYAYREPKSFVDDSIVRISNDWLKRVNSRNYHHFFPRAFLRAHGYEEFKANHVANITIVDDFLNKKKVRDRAPSNYMREFREKNVRLRATMKTHLINLDAFGVWRDDYDVFFRKRCEAIASQLAKRVIGREIDRMGQAVNLDDRDYAEFEESES